MPKDTSVTLGDHLAAFIEEQVEMKALRDALVEGEQSGPAVPFDFEAFIDRKRGRLPRS
jgi:Arc/MetJ-type ribon-helix-helix transcriptional regulator